MLPRLANAAWAASLSDLEEFSVANGFGTLARHGADPVLVDALLAEPLGAPEKWRAVIARELLLAGSWGLDPVDALWERFSDASPFAGGPTLAQLRGVPLAVAAFPTADDGGPPPWALLWLFGAKVGSDHAGRIACWREVASGTRLSECSVFLTLSGDRDKLIVGKSFGLAVHLAHRALGAEPGMRRDLAVEWIITGCVRAGRVEKVAVGNKPGIATARRWMFPADNRRDLLGHTSKLGVLRFPASVDGAWAVIIGSGVDRGSTLAWEQLKSSVVALHSFTSGAWQPVLQALLLARPAKLQLWHSAPAISANPATAIHKVVGTFGEPPELPLPRLISSSDLAEAEAELRAALEADLSTGGLVLFNITQGNRLMGMAPHGLAQLYPKLWLIYRDADATGQEFTVIRYDGESTLPTTHKLDGGVAAASVFPDLWQVQRRDIASTSQELEDQILAALGGNEGVRRLAFPHSVSEPLDLDDLYTGGKRA